MPATFAPHSTEIATRPGIFPYEPAPGGTVPWHMNFADRELFGFYTHDLFAQDEIQVAEHPALASLRQALCAAGRPPVTVEHGRPTPALVMGVERRCAIRTDGIYGNAFARASRAEIERATRVLVPPTRSNIVAIEAPKYGQGKYDRRTVEYALSAAFTGFSAARSESARLAASPRVELHTGFWGCGAFGGNRVVMATLQIMAARLAELDALVFHTVSSGSASIDEGLALADRIARPGTPVSAALESLVGLGFEWGESDGN
jgi:hypothetical protein